MNSSGKSSARRSRAKTLIGTLAATAAIAGVGQAALPASASALKPVEACREYVTVGHYWEARGFQSLANFFYERFLGCIDGE